VGIILIKKDEKRNERKEYIKNKTIFKVFNVTSTMWSGMRHANGHGLRPQCAVQFYCCYNTDRKKKKSEEKKKGPSLKLVLLMGRGGGWQVLEEKTRRGLCCNNRKDKRTV
jgi:hypothetical protein